MPKKMTEEEILAKIEEYKAMKLKFIEEANARVAFINGKIEALGEIIGVHEEEAEE